jgi:hypothetical protein
MYITKRLVVTEKDTLKSTFSVFRRDYFEKNTFKTLDEASEATWIRAEKERIEASRPTAVASAMGEALTKADLPQVKAPDGVIDSEGHLVAVAGVNSAIVTQREIAREEIVEAEVRSIGVDVSNPFDLPGEGGPDA